MASRKNASDLLPEYKMDHRRRGLAVIFNVQNFHWTLGLKERRGTAADKNNLIKRFQELGFDVKHYDDLEEGDMMDRLREAAKADHTDADCFVCVFLSHGEDGHVFAKDKKVDIKTITTLFKGDNCKSLVGKPKIFIFQACRGNIGEDAVTPMTAEAEDQVEEDAAIVYTLPAGADFLMCYCVADGFAAFRHTTHGSFYIQDLCETLQQQGSTLEFTKLLTFVSFKVSIRTFPGIKKQMPCFTSMLTKQLYFKPKEG